MTVHARRFLVFAALNGLGIGLFVVLIAAQLAGIVGMLIAIPLTTIVRVAVEQVLWSLRNYRIMKAT